MKISILGTGIVGSTLGARFIELGHEVMMGSRTADNAKAIAFVEANGNMAMQGSFEDAAKFGDIVFNCTSGGASLEALKMAGPENLKNKILVDVANPLDFSNGMPPILIPTLSNTTSLGEEIQKALPDTYVVKTFNTMNCKLMVNPELVNGAHDIFIGGNDVNAKAKVTELLASLGWKHPIDLGDISSARTTEMLLPIWIRLMGIYKTPNFNFSIVK